MRSAVDICAVKCYNSVCDDCDTLAARSIEVWLSLVERHVRDVEAVGSSPVTSTRAESVNAQFTGFFLCPKLTPVHYLSIIVQRTPFDRNLSLSNVSSSLFRPGRTEEFLFWKSQGRLLSLRLLLRLRPGRRASI